MGVRPQKFDLLDAVRFITPLFLAHAQLLRIDSFCMIFQGIVLVGALGALEHHRRRRGISCRACSPSAGVASLSFASIFGIHSPSINQEDATRRPQQVFGDLAAEVSKEEIGRATWLFLHTLAAQYPDEPTRQQMRDARQLVRRSP